MAHTRLSSALPHATWRAAAWAAATLCGPLAHAQDAPAVTETVQVTGRTSNTLANVAGFGDTPLARSPFQALSIGRAALLEQGVDSLSEVTRLDASLGDAYNSPGYWASFRVRGFKIDPRFSVQRDGLPINAETSLLTDNVERLEILKGTSGAQSGTSAPGGLVNLVVKRPRGDQRTAYLGWTEGGSLKFAVDLDQRLGSQGDAGLRINAAYEHLSPQTHDARGQRSQVAVASRLALTARDTLDTEFEVTRQSQPSVPGFSLLGSVLPAASSVNPRVNLNNQDWTQPVVFNNTTASVRWVHEMGAQWRVTSQLMTQHLRTDDRVAFPFGCSNENHYNAYCSDGSMDLYDFRSEGEKRHTDAASVQLEGRSHWLGLAHQFSTGLLWTRYQARMGLQAYNWAGIGFIDGTARTAAAAATLDQNTERDESSLQLHWRDVIDLDPQRRLWLGLRHSRLSRESIRTDGSRATAYDQQFTTPWLALSWQFSPALLGYASWGQGVESDVAPSRSFYANAGQVLPALRSRQTELGLKHDGQNLGWSATLFQIVRPKAGVLGTCDSAVSGSCDYGIDGRARHTGLEVSADWRDGPWSLRSSAQWLQARREGAQDPALNGRIPENVAERSLRLQLQHQVAALPGLQLTARVSREGARPIDEINSQFIPAWTTLGLAARYQWRVGNREMTVRTSVENALDRRGWKESPFQYEHVYLYPLDPRTLQISFQTSL